MITTHIDYKVLIGFFKNKPKSDDEGGNDDENLWYYTIKCYLKSKTNLQIGCYNSNLPYSNFINDLTTGRENSKLYPIMTNSILSETPIIENNLHSVFFSELNEAQCNNVKNKCGLLIGNLDNYKNNFNDLLGFHKVGILPVRESSPLFNSWNQLKDFLLPYTDVIIYDNFLLSDSSLLKSNLFQIIKNLSNSASVKFNILIFFKRKDENDLLRLGKIYESINEECIKSYQINCNLGLILTDIKTEFKEHDRGIFMNYMRIYSGDSFNYFKEDGSILTSGTDIHFQFFSNPNYFISANAALINIKNIFLNAIQNKGLTKPFIGFTENRLFNNI